jgi:Flp pilus assembly protein protease CpaA
MLSAMINIFFWIGLAFLAYFAYRDFKTQEIENEEIMVMAVVGLTFSWSQHNLLPTLVVMLFMGILGYYLWIKGSFGGADVKILPCIIPFLNLFGMGEIMSGMMIFLALLAVLGGLYGLTCNFLITGKGKKKIPFVPVMLLTFLVFWVFWKHILVTGLW